MLNQISDYELMDMYWTQHMSGKEIAAVLGCTPAAVCMRMKSSGIKARSPHDYPPTKKQIKAWKENGHRLGTSDAARMAGKKSGKANKGRRRRDDYEFGGHEKSAVMVT